MNLILIIDKSVSLKIYFKDLYQTSLRGRMMYLLTLKRQKGNRSAYAVARWLQDNKVLFLI